MDESNPAEDGAQPQPAGPTETVLVTPGKPTIVLSLPLTEQAGDKIGRCKLLQQIGEGGCGVVYMAEQEEPVRRRVALKVIKLGMDTKSVIARFEAERQALALMDHPNIAKVLDAGSTDAGRPFFVMELVRGIKITEYCDQNKLQTSEQPTATDYWFLGWWKRVGGEQCRDGGQWLWCHRLVLRQQQQQKCEVGNAPWSELEKGER
jgi:hypothetical protein